VHFVFQAEDGIRDRNVTGVQTCALPIYANGYVQSIRTRDMSVSTFDKLDSPAGQRAVALIAIREVKGKSGSYGSEAADDGPYPQIGRASCRERATSAGGGAQRRVGNVSQ